MLLHQPIKYCEIYESHVFVYILFGNKNENLKLSETTFHNKNSLIDNGSSFFSWNIDYLEILFLKHVEWVHVNF